LMPDELKNEDHKAKWKAFDVKVHEALGDAFWVEDFKDEPDLSNIKTPTMSHTKMMMTVHTSLSQTLMMLIPTLMIAT
jgi:hypothetical protein